MKHTVLLLLACGSVAGAAAQPLSLDECLAAAVSNNRTLQDSRLSLEAARQTRREAFTNYFPQISATGGAFRARHGLLQADFTLPQMGTLPLSFLKKGVFGGIVAVQPLFAGLQIANGDKLARTGEEVQRLQLQKSEAEVREQTEVYYWQIVSLQQNLTTLDAVERQLAEIHRQVSLSVEAGLVTANDLLRVELRRQEIASDRLRVENGLRISRLLLAQYIGVNRQGFDIAADTLFTRPEAPERHYVPTDEALDRRAETQLTEKNLEAKRYLTRMERGKRLPSAGVGAGYLYNDFTDKSVSEGVLFVQVSVPISDWWGGAHALKKARIAERQAENDRLQAREMLAVEIEKCWFDLQEAYARIELMRRSVASATENLRQNRNFYAAGTAPLSELLDAETLYTRSLNDLTSSCAAYRIALAAYKRSTGR
ncbi:MAG: TolC family protein [Rikenellaceae bacterium]|nr:TolC family protein [Rikenellaceae bacterium]